MGVALFVDFRLPQPNKWSSKKIANDKNVVNQRKKLEEVHRLPFMLPLKCLHENEGVSAVVWWAGLKGVSWATSKDEEPRIAVIILHNFSPCCRYALQIHSKTVIFDWSQSLTGLRDLRNIKKRVINKIRNNTFDQNALENFLKQEREQNKGFNYFLRKYEAAKDNKTESTPK